MIDFDLAIELKEKGYSQKGKGFGGCLNKEVKSKWCIEGCRAVIDLKSENGCKDQVLIATTDDLLEQLGDRLFEVRNNKNEIVSIGGNEDKTKHGSAVPKQPFYGIGSAYDEALARLWIALEGVE